MCQGLVSKRRLSILDALIILKLLLWKERKSFPHAIKGLMVYGSQGFDEDIRCYNIRYIGKFLCVPDEDIGNHLNKYLYILGFSRNAK